MNARTIIQYIFTIIFSLLFAIICISSFALSFMNLTDAAKAAGISSDWVWLWPLGIDTFIVMGSLFILQASIQRQSTLEGWAVVGIFTIISIAFNIAHSPEDPLSRAAHGVPPVALCWSLHLLMVRLKRDLTTRRDSEDTKDPEEMIRDIPFEKVLKVKSWFATNPGGTPEAARKDLRMSWSTVKQCQQYLLITGQIPSGQ